MGTALPRRAAQRFADHLNGVLNRTVSDSRLVVAPIPGEPDTFKLTRVVEEDDVPLELDGTTARLFVQQVVVVEDDQCRTESYLYRLQADHVSALDSRSLGVPSRPAAGEISLSAGARARQWDLRRREAGEPQHIATARVSLELVLRNLISDWGVKPRTNDWEAILKQSAEAFDHPSH